MPRPKVFPDVPDVVRRRMARIKSHGTKPEMIVRRAVHALGFRYRLHRRDLPGCPDLVFSRRRKVIFVHGCFWHRHTCSLARRVPITRQEYWGPKLKRNVERDQAALKGLAEMGWESLTVWECETTDLARLSKRLTAFLS
jgi:DNA mismatch endonuclease (patch repair protein)